MRVKRGIIGGVSLFFIMIISCGFCLSDSKDIKISEAAQKELIDVVSNIENDVVFNKSDVSIPSNATEEYLSDALEGTEIKDLAGTFIKAEKKYNVNSFFIAALVAHESGWGTSERAKNGSNNLTGFAVYKDSSKGAYFETREDNIMATAKLLSEDYLNENGEHFNGKSVSGVNTKYCIGRNGHTDYNWSKSITEIAEDLSSEKGEN